MPDFVFKEYDEAGKDTLETIAKADNFNEWMYQTILPYCTGRILEIGSGIGNISRYFIEAGSKISLSDLRKNYCDVLNQEFSDKENLKGIFQIDLADPEFESRYFELKRQFDTVFALNVIEHIRDDVQAIKNCSYFLKRGGNLIILVPAYQWLYNHFDTSLGHYRRYNRNQLKETFKSCDLKVQHTQYFNLAGIAGWFFSGNILGKKSIPESQIGIFNSLISVFKIIDRVFFHRIGLSVIVVGKK